MWNCCEMLSVFPFENLEGRRLWSPKGLWDGNVKLWVGQGSACREIHRERYKQLMFSLRLVASDVIPNHAPASTMTSLPCLSVGMTHGRVPHTVHVFFLSQ